MSWSCKMNRSINPKSCLSSSSVEEAINGPNFGDNGPKRKGLWTSEQDAILVEYVSKQGERNWNSIEKQTGLPRCGNSCRLRWINHLRPNLKKGAITLEEEERIIKLHAKFGNKWARIVSELPGRTDNKIKNFWNTRARRRLRSGLPIYPPELFRALNQNQLNMNLGTFFSGNTQHHSFSPNSNFVVPTMEFRSSEAAQPIYQPPLIHIPLNNIPNIPTKNLLTQDLNSTFYPSNSFQQSESLFHGFGAIGCDGLTGGIECPTINASVQTAQSFALPAPWSAIPEWHDNLNGTSLMNLEVPSVETQQSLGSLSSPFPSLETLSSLTCSLLTGNTELLNLSLESYRMLESMLFNEPQNNSCPQICNVSVMCVHEMGISSNYLLEIQPEAYGVSNSALGSSFALVNEYTPIGGNLSDAPSQSINTVPGEKGKAAVEQIPLQDGGSYETTNDTIFRSLDFLPEPNFFDPDSDFTNYPF